MLGREGGQMKWGFGYVVFLPCPLCRTAFDRPRLLSHAAKSKRTEHTLVQTVRSKRFIVFDLAVTCLCTRDDARDLSNIDPS